MEQNEHQNILSIHWSPGAPICDGPTYELIPDLSFIKPTESYGMLPPAGSSFNAMRLIAIIQSLLAFVFLLDLAFSKSSYADFKMTNNKLPAKATNFGENSNQQPNSFPILIIMTTTVERHTAYTTYLNPCGCSYILKELSTVEFSEKYPVLHYRMEIRIYVLWQNRVLRSVLGFHFHALIIKSASIKYGRLAGYVYIYALTAPQAYTTKTYNSPDQKYILPLLYILLKNRRKLRYVVHIPESLSMDAVAPLLCAGITVLCPEETITTTATSFTTTSISSAAAITTTAATTTAAARLSLVHGYVTFIKALAVHAFNSISMQPLLICRGNKSKTLGSSNLLIVNDLQIDDLAILKDNIF
ncbi:hypothetical protein LguiB_013607 [Lonicera macranthoides]